MDPGTFVDPGASLAHSNQGQQSGGFCSLDASGRLTGARRIRGSVRRVGRGRDRPMSRNEVNHYAPNSAAGFSSRSRYS